MTVFWFLARTHHNQEARARDALTQPYRACVVYLPLTRSTIIHARRKRTVDRAFLSRYLFVLDQGQGTAVIRSAPGVASLVPRGSGLLMVNQRWVDAITAREIDGTNDHGEPQRYVDLGEDTVVSDPRVFIPGEQVRVTDGPFALFGGIWERGLNNGQRAVIAVNIFGRMTPVELEPSQFERAA